MYTHTCFIAIKKARELCCHKIKQLQEKKFLPTDFSLKLIKIMCYRPATETILRSTDLYGPIARARARVRVRARD